MLARTASLIFLVAAFAYADDEAYIGLRARGLTAERAAELKLVAVAGAEVTLVYADSPASKSGMLVGDVLVTYQGVKVNDAGHLQTLIRQTKAGSPVTIEILRNGQRLAGQVKTGVRSATMASSSASFVEAVGGCLTSGGFVVGVELAGTLVVCGAELVFTGQTSFCEALLDTVLDNAPATAAKSCVGRVMSTQVPAAK